MVPVQDSKGPLNSVHTAGGQSPSTQGLEALRRRVPLWFVQAKNKDVGGAGGVLGRARKLETGKGGIGKVLEVSKARLKI